MVPELSSRPAPQNMQASAHLSVRIPGLRHCGDQESIWWQVWPDMAKYLGVVKPSVNISPETS